MSFFKQIVLLCLISSNCLYACNNGLAVMNELYHKYNNISPNVLNLCNDLHYQKYNFNIINNNNLGIYKNNNKLIEIPIDCKQPEINNCIKWSGIQFATNQTKQDMIVDLYFNILGFQNRQYNNIFKTNNKYKNVKLINVKHTYPLFKLEGNNYFTNIIRESIRNIIYTDPGKLLMYRLFLASTEKQNNTNVEFINNQLKGKIDDCNGLMEYNFPINIEQSYDGAIHSIKNSRIGISLSPSNLFSVISDGDSNNIGALARPIETSLYHEFVHCFKQLYFIQSVKDINKDIYTGLPIKYKELMNKQPFNQFEYKLRTSASVRQVFNLFSEYNNIQEPMCKKTIYDIFCSILLYRDELASITSNEEFATIMGIYPGSKYYYLGAELSENLFRYYTNIPIRDTHLSVTEADNPYSQSVSFINNVKNKIASLNLKHSNINFHLPQEKSWAVHNITHNNIINFYTNQINNINKLGVNNNVTEIVKGYNGCNYKLLDSALLYGIYKMLDKIKFHPGKQLSLYDVNRKIDEVY